LELDNNSSCISQSFSATYSKVLISLDSESTIPNVLK
jgi:hypothetical protein